MAKFKKNLFILIKLAFLKLFVLPFKYGKNGDYNAAQYWKDRFLKYDFDVRSVGIEGLSVEENFKERELAEKIFRDICVQGMDDFKNLKVLEIGCGIGFYTGLLKQLGVQEYLGVDITDAYFSKLQALYPNYRFIKKDITCDNIPETFDLVVMLDVIQHIVTNDKFKVTMDTIKKSLNPGGRFLVVPVAPIGKRHLFHVRFWSYDEVAQHFDHQYTIKRINSRKNEDLLIIDRKR